MCMLQVRNGNTNAEHTMLCMPGKNPVEADLGSPPTQQPASKTPQGSEGHQLRNAQHQACTESFKLASPASPETCNNGVCEPFHHGSSSGKTKIQEDSDVGCEPLAPVVRKLIRKHGGRMELNKLLGAISKKKKRRLGLTGRNSMTQVCYQQPG